MKKMVMIVYNQLKADARVLRAADALCQEFELTLIGLGDGSFSKKNMTVKEIILLDKNSIIKYAKFCKEVFGNLRHNRYDIIYAHDFYSAIFVDLISKNNIKTIYDAHELYIPQDGIKMSFRDKFYYQLEKQAVKKADKLICALEERAQIMKEHFDLDCIPFVVHNISFLKVPEDEVSHKLEIDTQSFFEMQGFTLVYAGALSRGRSIERLFELAYENKNDIKVLIIGRGDAESELKHFAEKVIPGKYLFTGNIPYNYLSILLKKCDVGFLNYPTNSLNNTYCASNKVYEYASVGLPMIAGYNPTLKKILEGSHIGVVEDSSSDNLDRCLNEIIENLDVMKCNCNEFVKNNSWDKEADNLRLYLKDLT